MSKRQTKKYYEGFDGLNNHIGESGKRVHRPVVCTELVRFDVKQTHSYKVCQYCS